MKESVFTRRDGPLDQGWLQKVLRQRRIQSISVTIFFDRDCWQWWTIERFKGTLSFCAGPIMVDIEA